MRLGKSYLMNAYELKKALHRFLHYIFYSNGNSTSSKLSINLPWLSVFNAQ